MSAGEREAAVKVSLDSGEFLAELRKMAIDLKSKTEEGKKQFKGMAAGIDAAKSSLSGLAQHAKMGLSMLASFGGAFTAGSAIKGAVELDARYRALSFRAVQAGHAMATTADVQQTVERVSGQTSRSLEETTKSFEDLYSASGDLQFTRDTLETIGTTATGTGASVETLTNLADQLHDKFGVAASGMKDAFATIFGGTLKGGPQQMAEFSEVIAQMGANLNAAGLTGGRGFRFMIGALNATDGPMKNLPKQVMGIQKVLLNLGKGSEMKAIGKDLGLDPEKLVNEKDSIARLMKVLSFGEKGLKTLKAHFVGNEEQQALKALFTQPFEEALNRAKARGLKGKDAVDQALGVLKGQIDDFGKTTVSAASIQAEADKNKQAPAQQLTEALNTLKTAMAQPEIIQGVNDLAKFLPDVARLFGSFLSTAARNPILSGALGIGVSAGTAFVGGITKTIVSEIVKGHLSGGEAASGMISEGMKNAGAAAGVLMAAAIAAAYIDAKADEDSKTTKSLAETEAAAAGNGGSIETQEAQANALAKALAAKKKSRSGFGGVMEDVFSGIGGAVTGGPGAATLADSQIREASRTLDIKRAHIAQLKEIRASRVRLAELTPEAPTTVRHTATPHVSPHAIGIGVRDALGGLVMDVRVVSTPGGIAATDRGGGGGGRGPLKVPAAAHGGGT